MKDALVKGKDKVIKNKVVLGFSDGFKSLFRGLKFVYSEHLGLAKFYLPPMLIGLIILLGGMLFFAGFVDDIVNWMWEEPENWALHIIWGIFHFVAWLVLAAATIVAALFTFMIATAPFNDLISEKVEGILGTWEVRPFNVAFMLKDLGRTLMLELTRLGIKLLWLVPLFIVSLVIPVVGPLAYLILGGYLLAKFLGMDYVDWNLARRRYTHRERLDFAKQHRWALVGFGSAMLLLLIIPVSFVFVWPGAVAGGTILCTRLGPDDRRDRAEGGDA